MSWDIFLFNTKQHVKSIEELDEQQFSPCNFNEVFEKRFKNIVKDKDHRLIVGNDFSIEYFEGKIPITNIIVSIVGENGFFELIELAKLQYWVIFDTGNGEIIDLNNPSRNGYEDYQKYLRQVLSNKNEPLL